MKYKLLISKILIAFFTIIYTLPVFFYEEGPVGASFFIYSLVISVIIFLLFVPFRVKFDVQKKQPLNVISFKSFILLIIFLFFIYTIIVISTYNNFTGFFNRSTRNSELLQGNLYVILDIILKSIFFCLLKYSNRHKKFIILLVIFSLFFDFSYLGARRTSVFVLLMFIWTNLEGISKPTFFKIFSALVFFGISSFLFSGYREIIYSGIPISNFSQIVGASFYTNEFQVVSLNLLDYINYTNKFGNNPFQIILSLFIIFIPRFIWQSKPLTLDKKLEIFPNIFGQLYYNYGILTIIIFLLILYFMFRYLSRNHQFSMLIFAMIPDLFRTTIDQFLFVLFLHIIFIKLLTSFFTKRNIKI